MVRGIISTAAGTGAGMLVLAGLFSLLTIGLAVDFSGLTRGDDEGDGWPDETADDLSEADDAIDGTDGADILSGDRDGAPAGDLIEAGAGDDQVNGHAGADTIAGGPGADDLRGEAGDDSLSGDDGDDTLRGGEGRDILAGGDGGDSLAGEGGDDTLAGGDGQDSLIGGEGDDRLDGGEGEDALQGGLGHDTLIGGAGQDTLMGGDGNDRLDGRHGRPDGDGGDYLNGGAGDDTILAGDGDWATGGSGADRFELTGRPGAEDGIATIGDYDPAEDQIVVTYDPIACPDPAITVEQPAAEGAAARILIDGVAVAQVFGAGHVDPAAILLRPEAPAVA